MKFSSELALFPSSNLFFRGGVLKKRGEGFPKDRAFEGETRARISGRAFLMIFFINY